MKPLLLYTLPRARGTVSLTICKKSTKLNEPMWQINSDPTSPMYNIPSFSKKEWPELVVKMNDVNTASKIHPRHLHHIDEGREWYNNILNTKSHDIVVIERKDRLNQFLSLLLANHHGFRTKEMPEILNKFTVTDLMIAHIKRHIEWHMLYYPTYGKVYTYESLPDEHFNTHHANKYEWKNQHSYLRHNYIINLSWVITQLTDLLNFYEKEWNDKILSLNTQWEF